MHHCTAATNPVNWRPDWTEIGARIVVAAEWAAALHRRDNAHPSEAPAPTAVPENER